MRRVRVASGDCISSLAATAGLPPDRVWAANGALAATRDNPNLLAPGDTLTVPDREPKNLARASSQRHRFCIAGDQTLLRLKLLRTDLSERAFLRYTMTIDGSDTRRGTTDGNGMVEQNIPPTAAQVAIAFTENGHHESYLLPLGTLEPVEHLRGVQQRLLNLGFDCGPVDGVWGSHTSDALRAYQELRGPTLSATGRLDDASRADLKASHGC